MHGRFPISLAGSRQLLRSEFEIIILGPPRKHLAGPAGNTR
jgi:hypothetical protein